LAAASAAAWLLTVVSMLISGLRGRQC
jgi:hypothetical protein